MLRTTRLLFALCCLSVLTASAGEPPRFYPDDPLLVDDDRVDTPIKPAEIELSDHFDRFGHLFHDFGSPEESEAQNVNTLDEVPDSSWFTNRHARERLSTAELVRGPDTGHGPVGVWTIFKTKTQGLTPGFHILDERGDRYVIKLDSHVTPELATSVELISTKIFHAIGYHVPENHIAELDPKAIQIKPGTRVKDEFGDSVPMSHAKLDRLLRRAQRLESGRIRVLASKYIEGHPLGPFRYYGTRSDDPNDIIPHEYRRELRGLRLIAAWLNHDDTRAQNTQDSWVARDGKHFVRHWLIDFGSTLGSGTTDAQLASGSRHYWMEPGLMKKNLLGFGLHTPFYRKVKFPAYEQHPSVGRYEAESFDPAAWKNDYPNPAFVRMSDRDGYWAAKQIMAFTPEEIRAIVKTGQYSDQGAEDYMVETLLARQRKCGETYMSRVNPLDDFRYAQQALEFTNLGERYGLAGPGSDYHVQWSFWEAGRNVALSVPQSGKIPRFEPPTLEDWTEGERILQAEIHTHHPQQPGWNRAVRVHLSHADGAFRIVGLEREADPGPKPPQDY